MKKTLILLLAISLLGALTFGKKIIIATGEYSPFISESIPGYGPVSEIVAAAAKAGGIDIEIKFYPWARAQGLVKNGTIIATYYWNKTPEREKEFLYSKFPVVESSTAIFYKKKNFPNGLKFEDWPDLKGYKVLGVNSFWYQKEFEKLKIECHYVNETKLAWKMLINDRGEVYPENNLVGIFDAKSVLGDQYSEIGYTEQKKQTFGYLIFSKNNKDAAAIKKKFDKGLKKIHNNGTYTKLLSKLK